MALTKVSRGLLSTGIVDNSNATAITLNADESATFAGNLTIGTVTSSTALTSGSQYKIKTGQQYWNSTKGTDSSIKLELYSTGSSDTYGLGVSTSELEIQAQADIGFYAGGASTRTKRMHISGSTGNVSITDGNLVVANGHGIDFSAAANSHSGSSASILNDFETGTWTPVFVGSSSGTGVNSAVYTKIGNLVTAHCYIQSISPATSGDQQIITGLPFNASASNHYGVGTIVYSVDADVTAVGVLVQTNSAQIYFHYIDGTSGNSLTRANWNTIKSSQLALILSVSYRTDE